MAIDSLGEVAWDAADFGRAEALFAESHAIFRELGDEFWGAFTALFLANCALSRGDLARAEEWCDEALSGYRGLGHPWGIAMATDTFGRIAFARGDHELAAAMWRQSLTLYTDGGRSWDIAETLCQLSMIALGSGDALRAARLLGAADALLVSLDAVRSDRGRDWLASHVAATRAALGEAAYDAAWEAGRAFDLREAVAEALAVAPRDERRPPTTAIGGNPLGLTPRQLEVLRLVAEARSDQEIADALFISRRTVTTHLTNIFAKLGVDSRTGAGIYAVRHGLV
jgi:DNA-binding NarL/FixJ family response regulator